MAKLKTYDADSLRKLVFPDSIRKRPGVYVGGVTSDTGLFRIFKEAVDNSVDEATNGHGAVIYISYNSKTKVFVVADRGRGIPTGMNKKEKKSGLEIALTDMHGSGKFDQDSYVSSSGLNGLGLKALVALSEYTTAWSANEGVWKSLSLKRGIIQGGLTQSKPSLPFALAKLKGTVVEWKPDTKIFGDEVIRIERIHEEIKNLAMLNTGIEFIVHIDGKTSKYISVNGLLDMLYGTDEQKASALVKPFHYKKDGLIDIAVCWNDDDIQQTWSYVNSSHTPEEGTHVQGARNALLEALRAELDAKTKTDKKPTGKRSGKAKDDTLDAKYLLMGIRMALNYRMSNPVYSGQTKDKLTNSETVTAVKNIVLPEFSSFLKKNPKLISTLIDRAKKFQKASEKFQQDLKAVKSISLANPSTRGLLPGKLAQARGSYKPEQIELFLVEGDSASGPCFVGGTEVRLLNGAAKTFEQLVLDNSKGIKNYGYAYDIESKQTQVAELKAPRITKYVTELIDVQLSNGVVETCTPDHLWLLRTGEYRRAEDLRADDELMPHTEYVEFGRRYVVSPKFSTAGKPSRRGARADVYRLAGMLKSSNRKNFEKLLALGANPQIHHKDHDTENDLPGNLVVLSSADHLKEHADDVTPSYGDANGHSIKMRTDSKYNKEVTARTKKYFGTYWASDKHRSEQAKRTAAHFMEPKVRKAHSELNRAVVIATHMEISKMCKNKFSEASFNRARDLVASKRGVKKINVRFDYWEKFFVGTLSSYLGSL